MRSLSSSPSISHVALSSSTPNLTCLQIFAQQSERLAAGLPLNMKKSHDSHEEKATHATASTPHLRGFVLSAPTRSSDQVTSVTCDIISQAFPFHFVCLFSRNHAKSFLARHSRTLHQCLMSICSQTHTLDITSHATTSHAIPDRSLQEFCRESAVIDHLSGSAAD